MKIIKTALGWEIQPQGETEVAHVKWLLDCLATRPALIPVVIDPAIPEGVFAITREQLQKAAETTTCPRCYEYGCYNGISCRHCGYRYVAPPAETGEMRTFTTKGPIE